MSKVRNTGGFTIQSPLVNTVRSESRCVLIKSDGSDVQGPTMRRLDIATPHYVHSDFPNALYMYHTGGIPLKAHEPHAVYIMQLCIFPTHCCSE
jgi:hypothetical protein